MPVGSITESVQTIVELEDRAQLIEHLLSRLYPIKFDAEDVYTKLHFPNKDYRNSIGWSETYAVVIRPYGIVGFTDEEV
jgi:hypothetical protein